MLKIYDYGGTDSHDMLQCSGTPNSARARAATADGATVAGPLRLLPEAKMDNIPNGKDLIAKGEKFIGCKEEFLPCKFPGRVVGQVADFLPASYVTFFHIPTDRIDRRIIANL